MFHGERQSRYVMTFSHHPENVDKMAETFIGFESVYKISEWKRLRRVGHYEPELEPWWHQGRVEKEGIL